MTKLNETSVAGQAPYRGVACVGGGCSVYALMCCAPAREQNEPKLSESQGWKE